MSASARREIRSRTNTLGISQAVLDALIDKLEDGAQSAASARAAPRVPFRRLALPVSVFHADSSRSVIQVACRNLSAGGIAILHSSYVHVGSQCEVLLPRAGLSPVPVPGRVVRCRHVGGKVHEIGIKFTRPIEPRKFATPGDADLRRVLDGVNPAEFSARVQLMIGDDALRRSATRLLEESTKSTVIVRAEGRNPAPPDVLLCQLPPADANVSETLIQIAQSAMDMPVVMIAPDHAPATLARLKEYAPDSVVYSPLDLVGLCRALVEAMVFSTR